MLEEILRSKTAGRLLSMRIFAVAAAVLLAGAAFVSVRAYRRGAEAVDSVALNQMTTVEMGQSGMVLLAYSGESLERMVGPKSEGSFVVIVEADGEEIPVTARPGDSIEEVVNRSGVVLAEEDQLSHMPYRPVEPNDIIVVERITRDLMTTREEIPFGSIKVESSLIPAGKTSIVYAGAPGIREKTYECLLANGVVVEQTLISDKLVSEPVAQKILVGKAGAPVSPFNFEWELDENGIPADYETVLSSCRAAGYSAGPRAGTASGRKAMVGNVAVNPNVIPYGSKLYIVGSDGFVYGYAVAADTGTALMQGIIDIDLFYQTYLESCLNAIRTVDIYILEYPS